MLVVQVTLIVLTTVTAQARPADSEKTPDLNAIVELASGDFSVYSPAVIIKTCSAALANDHKLPLSVEARLYELRGDAFYQLRYYEKARQDFDALVKMRHNDLHARLKRGATLIMLGQYDAAISDFRTAIHLDPKCGRAYVGLEAGLSYAGHLGASDCIKMLDKAIELDPECADAYHERAFWRTAQYDFEGALKDINYAVKVDPRDKGGSASIYVLRTIVLCNLGNAKQALWNAQVARKLDKSSPLALAALWLAYYNSGKQRIARQLAEQIVRSYPKYAHGYILLGLSESLAGQYQKALKLSAKAVALGDNDADILRKAAIINLGAGQFGNAMALFQKAAENSLLGNPFVLAGQAYVLSACPDKKVRDGRKACALAAQASKIFKDKHPRFLMLRGIAHAECGEFKKALQWAKAALEACPPGFDFKDQYRDLLQQFERSIPHRWEKGRKSFDYFRN
jgi:tetratricopeptide (TPR) repeat protein